jgi:hypothetical protein
MCDSYKKLLFVEGIVLFDDHLRHIQSKSSVSDPNHYFYRPTLWPTVADIDLCGDRFGDNKSTHPLKACHNHLMFEPTINSKLFYQ